MDIYQQSLLFNMLSRFVIAFLPRSKCLFISWLQSPSAAILEPPKIVCHCFHCFPISSAMKWRNYMPWSLFSECWILSKLFHSPLSLSSRGSSIPVRFLPWGWCHLSIWDYWYSSRQSWFHLVLHPAHQFLMMYSAYKLNKQFENVRPWLTPFPIWNQSVVPCPVLTVASWPAYRFLRRQVR